jgi:hypothetical protein
VQGIVWLSRDLPLLELFPPGCPTPLPRWARIAPQLGVTPQAVDGFLKYKERKQLGELVRGPTAAAVTGAPGRQVRCGVVP